MSTPSPFAAQLADIPVRTDEIELLGATTRVWTYGPDDADVTMLAVHGFRGDHHGLEQIVANLPGIRIIVADLPGFGASPALPNRAHSLDSYVAWLTALSAALAPGAPILGHSFGSIIAAEAVARGLPAARVILVNPIGAPALAGPRGLLTRLAVLYYRAGAALPRPLGEWLLRMPLIVRVMSSAMAKTSDQTLRRWIHEEHDRYFAGFADRTSLAQAFEASVSNDVRASVARIAQPTLLIAATLDDITPIEAERSLAAQFSNATLVEVNDVGHLIHYEKPREAAQVIAPFVSARAARDASAR